MGENVVKKKKKPNKKRSMRSVSSLITQWPSSELGLLRRKEEITPNHIPKQNKVQEPNESRQKKALAWGCHRNHQVCLVSIPSGKKEQILSKNPNKLSGFATVTDLHRCL